MYCRGLLYILIYPDFCCWSLVNLLFLLQLFEIIINLYALPSLWDYVMDASGLIFLCYKLETLIRYHSAFLLVLVRLSHVHLGFELNGFAYATDILFLLPFRWYVIICDFILGSLSKVWGCSYISFFCRKKKSCNGIITL
jgi:hypothetical protein